MDTARASTRLTTCAICQTSSEARRRLPRSSTLMSSPTEEVAVPQILPHRLERDSLHQIQAGCALVLGVFLVAIGGLCLSGATQGKGSWWVLLIVGGGFSLFGILTLWGWFSQLFAAGTPRTLVEISEPSLVKGRLVQIALIQPGPVKLRRLSLRLVCKSRTAPAPGPRVTTTSRGTRRRRDTTVEKLVREIEVGSAQHVSVHAGDVWNEVYHLTVPEDAAISSVTSDPRIKWRLEVRGKLQGLGAIAHAYEVRVVAGE